MPTKDNSYIEKFTKQVQKGTPAKNFKKGMIIKPNNKMDSPTYSYKLTAKYGDIYHDGFKPYFTPAEMLKFGIFEGKYLNDSIHEFPKEWFLDALKYGRLSPEFPDVNCNYFGIKSRQSLQVWRNKGWIIGNDSHGFFQWYCRYYIGRREPEIDSIQIKRWKQFKRHYQQVKLNCTSIKQRPKQRQALLQWGYNCFVVGKKPKE